MSTDVFDHAEDNEFVCVEEQDIFEWPRMIHDDSLPQLLSEADALALPKIIDQFDDELSQLCSSGIFSYQWYPSQTIDDVTIDDIDLDSFSWNNQSLPSNSDGDDPNKEVAVCKVIVPSSSGGASISMREERVVRRRATGRSRLSNIGFEELRNYFYMPITKAAKEMNVGLTVLKKRCRELGIPRWPHRKMKSLSSLIHNVQELGKGSPDSEESIQKELEMLELHRQLMEENPDVQLTERTKKLRQACFKANYKKRRALQHPCIL
ncbi:protein RKD3-like [Ananas comosus]|uniref:Protein RKD3 n=2 Tax=Ananas comosus TaxID=4615 RepID=A0A199VEV5_ANACO|nr:protein RKD3-like [Ananas comosus]OAY75406.1 Protein RKD3 [Ananas comosus]CAD1824303.1 unnamed protein product [Ananas comosus var. bracteatus]